MPLLGQFNLLLLLLLLLFRRCYRARKDTPNGAFADAKPYELSQSKITPRPLTRSPIELTTSRSRPVNDFRTLVRPPDFQRLQDFVYIDSKESLSEVSAFIDGIGERKKSSRSDRPSELPVRNRWSRGQTNEDRVMSG
ncbi:hypothetical protein B0H19DRAFT_1083325 [Mycena capillaripes]|nr:hypothetical protein B0H19DRAFT_1083325 [Mycena capillaripes]